MMIDDRLVNSLTENRHHRAANLKVVLTPPSPLKYIFSLYYIPIASSFRLREALIFGPFLYSP